MTYSERIKDLRKRYSLPEDTFSEEDVRTITQTLHGKEVPSVAEVLAELHRNEWEEK